MTQSQTVRTATKLGAALRQRRRDLGLSQGALGALINARQATISTVESGVADTRLSTLIDMLAALDVELVIRPRGAGAPPELEELF
jgi:HTH-type transcriptional regulator/antitoxin HipB